MDPFLEGICLDYWGQTSKKRGEKAPSCQAYVSIYVFPPHSPHRLCFLHQPSWLISQHFAAFHLQNVNKFVLEALKMWTNSSPRLCWEEMREINAGIPPSLRGWLGQGVSTSRTRTLRRQRWLWIPPAALSAILRALRNCSVTWKGTDIFWKESPIQRPAKCLLLLWTQPHTHRKKSCPQIPFTCLFLSFSLPNFFLFKIILILSFSSFFLFFWRGKAPLSAERQQEQQQLCRHACSLSHTRRAREMEKEPTSGMLNRILPRETSRNHTLLWTHIHSLLSLLFPWILWQGRTPRFLEKGLCTLATFPAALAGKKCLQCWRLPYCAYGNSSTPGNPSQGSLENGEKRENKEEKMKEGRKEKKIKERQVRWTFMWKFLHSVPDWDL